MPALVTDWVSPGDLERTDPEPDLRPEITVLAEQNGLNRLDLGDENPARTLRLDDHPEVQDAWLSYLADKWEPWAAEMRRRKEVQDVYDRVDYLRRRVEESEERYELLLGVGLLQWRDPSGEEIKRHLLTAPAEIELDAVRGVLAVAPAASFEQLRAELDMLEPQAQPHLDVPAIRDQLEQLDVRAWDTTALTPILNEIGNRLRADAQVEPEGFRPAERAEERPRIRFAPALVLRERRSTAYHHLVDSFLETANGAGLQATAPWRRLLREGASAQNDAEVGTPAGDAGIPPIGKAPQRILFPKPWNDEQFQIVNRLEREPCVLVKGPPGTGKSHTIANLICHLLARGDRVLVTAHAPKGLAVLRDLLPDDIRGLSVTALGSSREDQRLLEESVRGILWRRNEWRGADHDHGVIEDAEARLQQLQGQMTTVERKLRESREAETLPHSLPGGYRGTAAEIARAVADRQEWFRWFPEVGHCDNRFPLDAAEVALLAELHAELDRRYARRAGSGCRHGTASGSGPVCGTSEGTDPRRE